MARGLRPIFHFFGSTPSEDALKMFDRLMPPGRLHAAFEDGDAIGGAGVSPPS